MKFEVEFEVKFDSDSKNKGELAKKIKKKAIELAGKALDAANTALVAAGDAIDDAADALIAADIALDDEITADDDSDGDDSEDDDLKDDDGIIKEDLREYTLWEYLDEISDYTIDSSSKTIDCAKEVEKFLQSIDFEANYITLKAFEVAVTLKKITYATVIPKVEECYSGYSADDIKNSFIDDFVHWLVNVRPDVDENCRNVNFMLLVKYFVKRVRAS